MESRIFEIYFCNPEDQSDFVTYRWRVANTIGAGLWLKMLKQVCEEGVNLRSRFAGFLYSHKDWDFYGKRINKCISIINDSDLDYTIVERFEGDFTQEFSNKIHHHFEVLIGPDWDKTELFQNAPDEVSKATCGLNEYIHEMESLHRSQSTDFENRFYSVFGIFEWTKAIEIPAFCNDEFTLDFKWGDIVLNYAQIGKTWFEVYLDQDEEIFPEAILPLRQLTGSFDIFFGELHEPDKILSEVKKYISKSNGNPEDPNNRIGCLPVAHLEGVSANKRESLIESLNSRQRIKKVRVFHGDQLQFEKSFEPAADHVSF